MKILLLSIFALLPFYVSAESASMTLQALDSMQRADADARRICENIRREPDCIAHVQEMRTALGLSTIACRARFSSQNCEQVVNDRYPEFADQIATCSADDVCQSALVSTIGRGCGRYGIQVKDQFVSAAQSINACVHDWGCMGRQAVNGIMTVLMPGRAIAQAAQSTIQGVRDDFNRAQVMGCFNSVTQAQFMCHLLVKYGMAVATAGRATVMLGRMGALEGLMRLSPAAILRSRRLIAQHSQRMNQSGNFRFFRQGRGEAPVTLRPGESYVVVVSRGKVIIGERYRNTDPSARSSTAQTHLMLLTDVNGRRVHGSYQGGAVRMNRDGSFDVSGFRRASADQASADTIANAIREAIPNARVRVTADRMSTLPPR